MTGQSPTTWTIVVAAGTGSRFGSETPKQFVEIASRRVLDWSVIAAATVSDGVVVVLPADGAYAKASVTATSATETALIVTAVGGASRSASVRNGLAQVPDSAQVILVHDAARPVASPQLFARVVAAVRDGAKAVVPVVDVVDTIRHIDGHTVDRDKLQSVQTPQGFAAATLRGAHATGAEATDDASLVAASGVRVDTIQGERWNIKLTDPTDGPVIAALLRVREP